MMKDFLAIILTIGLIKVNSNLMQIFFKILTIFQMLKCHVKINPLIKIIILLNLLFTEDSMMFKIIL